MRDGGLITRLVLRVYQVAVVLLVATLLPLALVLAAWEDE